MYFLVSSSIIIKKSSETKTQEASFKSPVSTAGKDIQEQQTPTSLEDEKGRKLTLSLLF